MLNRYATGLSLYRRAEVAALYHRAFPPSERIALPLLRLGTLRRGVELEVYEDGGLAARGGAADGGSLSAGSTAPAGDSQPAGGRTPAGGAASAAPAGISRPAGGGRSGAPAGRGGPGAGSRSVAGDGPGGFVGFTYTVHTPEVVFLLFLAVDDALQGRGYGSQILGDVLERAGRRPVVLDIEPLDPGADNIGQRYRRLAFYQRHGLELTGYDVLEGDERYTVLSSAPPLHVPALGRALRRLTPQPLRLPGLETTRYWPQREASPNQEARPGVSVPGPRPAGIRSAVGQVECGGAGGLAGAGAAVRRAGAGGPAGPSEVGAARALTGSGGGDEVSRAGTAEPGPLAAPDAAAGLEGAVPGVRP